MSPISYLKNNFSLHTEEDDDEEKDNNSSFEKLLSNRAFEKKLLEKRKIFLWGVIDDKSAKEVVNKLLYLDTKNSKEPITLYLNSPGGMVTSGMVIYDTMQLIESSVHTVCMGLAASMASILLSAGEKEHRYIFPHGEVMIHQPSLGGVFQGTSIDIEIQAEQIKKTKELGAEILSKNCNQTKEKIIKDFDRDYWMNAQEAIQYKIVDKVSKHI